MNRIILFASALLTSLVATAQKVIVISDTHLCDQRMQNAGLAWSSEVADDLVTFLDYVESSGTKTLVLNGDVIDMWTSTVYQPSWADVNNNPVSRTEYVKLIHDANTAFFNKLKMLRSKGVEIVYVPGNHDMSLSSEDWETIAPGLVTYYEDAPGVGKYSPRYDVVIEHSHRYDIMSAPDPISHKLVFGEDSKGLLPVSFFATKLGTTKEQETGIISTGNASDYSWFINLLIGLYELQNDTDDMRANYYQLGMSFMSAAFSEYDLDNLPVTVKSEDFGEGYVWSDYGWNEENGEIGATLYPQNYSIKNWNARCKANGARKPIPWTRAFAASVDYSFMDEMAFTQMLNDTNVPTRVVVFGHTHQPKMITNKNGKGEVLYVNSGCWVNPERDKGTRTFVEIDMLGDGYDVALRRFNSPENITTLNQHHLVTGIDYSDISTTTINHERPSDYPAYNLFGMPVDDSYRGIVIKNGRKFMRK